jgi:tRNA threonylcarbamoyladenosine biosynthesis protein TsaB
MLHAEKLAVYVQELLQETNLKPAQLQAVAVSAGPGSYTGLRIATSFAKGLCIPYATPLISISSLLVFAEKFIQENSQLLDEDDLICPLLDARRMEVFTAVYSIDGETYLPPTALELNPDFLAELLDSRRIHFIGNGAGKTGELIQHPHALFYPNFQTSSSGMAMLAYQKFVDRSFENLAYFEPAYLKEAFITTPKPKA